MLVTGFNEFGQLGKSNKSESKSFASVTYPKIKLLPNQNSFFWRFESHINADRYTKKKVLEIVLSLKVIQKDRNIKLPKPILFIILSQILN